MDDEETFIQAINLLWNLCESSSTALDRAFENFKLLELFLNYLDKSPRVRIPILQCILTVSEDNPKSPLLLEERILACGIILNIMSSECDENELKIILGIISLVLDQDHRLLISEFSKRLSLKNEELEGKSSSTDKSSMDTEDNSELELISLLNAQQRALEILTNLFCDSGDMKRLLKELIEGGSSDDRLFEIWTELGTLCFGESQENDISVLESAISALRALTQRLCEIRCKNFSSITFQELNMMLELTKISGSEVRINVVHIVGNLGALNLGDDVTKGLANFLLETAHRIVMLVFVLRH
ncbi:unnamed protein product [Lepeophtheirus salmonis]|uniref:(salmon louse) hypothetical protein n=1 Tax=Lepeophtheirus salmonis TaxID=72036 RepID=A0A7R8CIC6_LEPSM|nr:unnamed protein product [Lepeophtheirus salmonis]CAF2776842.1 unnamed protein product [Lepeophtheirus salmonis]